MADVYDALISERPYKRAWTLEEARNELRAQAGRQLDPTLTELFLKVVGETGVPNSAPELSAAFISLNESIRASALEETSISVMITKAHQRLVYVNRAFSRSARYSLEEVIGRNPAFFRAQLPLYKTKRPYGTL